MGQVEMLNTSFLNHSTSPLLKKILASCLCGLNRGKLEKQIFKETKIYGKEILTAEVGTEKRKCL